MEAKSKRERKPSSLAPTIKKTPPRKHSKATKLDLPATVAGPEVVGREVSIAKICGHTPTWIAGKVTAFDESKVLHQVAYKLPLPEDVKGTEGFDATEWLSLGNVAFTWLDKPHAFPFANPTFSRQHTPKKEEAIGKRVKVYWSIMGKWYQGVIDAYDSSSGMHRVKFKDGEQRHYKLAHEAFVWLDIPALSSGSAIKKVHAEEGQVPVPDDASNDENKPPSRAADVGTVSIASRKKSRLGKAEQAPVRKYTRRQHNQNGTQALPNGTSEAKPKAKPKKAQPAAPLASDAAKSSQTAKKAAEAPKAVATSIKQSEPHQAEGVNSTHSSSDTRNDGAAVKAEPEKSSTLANCLEATKSASSSSEKVQSPLASPPAVQVVASTSPKCVDVKVWTEEERNLPDGAKLMLKSPELNRKRPRTDLGSPQACAESPLAKQGTPEQKQGKGLVKAGSKSRIKQPGRSCKTAADFQFVESCEAIKGSRVAVYWESDDQYYKGQVKGYSTCSKTLKIQYDDGYSQKNLGLKGLNFKWLTPRAVSAGATDKLHEAFQNLGASNVTQPTHTAEERASVAVEVQVKMEAKSPEGLHPSRPKIEVAEPAISAQPSPPSAAMTQQSTQTAVQGLLASQALQNGHTGVCMTSLVPLQARLPLTGMTTSSPSLAPNPFLNGQQHAIFLPQPMQHPVFQPAAPSIHGVLQAASCQAPLPKAVHYPGVSQGSSCPQSAEQRTSQTPSPVARSPAAGAAAYRKPPQPASSVQPCRAGTAAIGSKVSIVFRGDGEPYEGLIIAFNPKDGKHRILYEDNGEDEWIDLQQEGSSLSWLGKCKGYAAGLPKGYVAPSGKDWDNWRISVYWNNEDNFYDGTVCEPDGETADLAQLKVAYDDGEVRYESMSDLIFKYLDPPPSEGENEEDGEDRPEDCSLHNSRKRPRSDPDYKSEAELEYSVSLPQPRLSLNLKVLNSAPCRFLSRSSIRRMPSGRGSLLQFSGEDLPMSPVQTPLSPQLSLGCGSLRQDGRGPPAAVRNINGLRTVEGYRVDVKRVRIFYTPEAAAPSLRSSKELPPLPGPAPAKETAKITSAEVPQASVVSAKLKAMLERVEQAKENIRNGMPLEPSVSNLRRGFSSLASMPSSRPSDFATALEGEGQDEGWPEPKKELLQIEEDPAAEEQGEKSKSILSAAPPPISEHLTPPPSPFQGISEPTDPLELPPLIQTASDCPGDELGDQQTSLNLPQTPSARYEKVPRGPSRTESDVLQAPVTASECCPA